MTYSYAAAVGRNRGLVSKAEQDRVGSATVAIAGAGGVGGWHAIALARQGVTRFRLADPDVFDVVNFNRQAGATMSTLGQRKALVLKRMIEDINPEAEVEAWTHGLDETNTSAFVAGADVVIDGVDFFAFEARRRLVRAAQAAGAWTVTCGPIGFGAAFVAFDPDGMSFDDYFGIEDGMPVEDQLVSFLVGLTPRALHLPYMDFSSVDVASGAGPSSGAACMMCGAVVAVEVVALLSGKRLPRAAPKFMQWDLMRNKLAVGHIWGGGARNPMHWLRRAVARAKLRKLGVFRAPTPSAERA